MEIPDVRTPPVMVKPCSTDPVPSVLLNVTVEPPVLLAMVVTEGPFELLTVIAFPLKLMFSVYVPGETRTVSPLTAALIAA